MTKPVYGPAPDWIDSKTWLPRDYETAPRCECGCRKYDHRAGERPVFGVRRLNCLYGGRHPERECARYDPQQGLGL